MRYVLDSSVALKWVLPEPDAAKAIRLRNEFHNGLHELVAPDIFPAELGHALTRAERQGRVTSSNGWLFWQSIMADCPQLRPYLPLMPSAYLLSSSARVGVYDCLYVLLAQQEGCAFLTADARLATNLQTQFPFIVVLSSLP